MADGLTPNYNWIKPEVSASPDTWGAKQNGVMDQIDAKIKQIDGVTAASKSGMGASDWFGVYDSLEGDNKVKKVTFADWSESFKALYGDFYVARANHTGEQAISTVTGLQAALDSKETLLTGHASINLRSTAVGDADVGVVMYSVDATPTLSLVRRSGPNGAYEITQTGTGGVNVAAGSGKFNVSGDVLASGNITAYSDERLKSDVETIDEALGLVNKLRGVSFTVKETGKRNIGVIAQEVMDVVPEVVHNNSSGLLSVSYGNLVGLLIEAVKELSEKVNRLEKQ